MLEAIKQAGPRVAVDTFMVFVGVYASVDGAKADYELDVHRRAGLIDAYDAAVVVRRDDGNVKIQQHETPTRVGGVLGGAVGLPTDLAVVLFPFAAIGGGLLPATSAGGAVLRALAGHARDGHEPRGPEGAG